MKNVLDNRWLTLFLSLVLAVGFWLHVHGELDSRRTIPVRINYLRSDKKVAYGQRPRSIMVEVKGPGAVVERLSENDFHIDLDLTPLALGTVEFGSFEERLRRDFPRGIDILSIEPRTIRFEVEPFVTKSLPIEVEWSGELENGFQFVGSKTKPETILVGGAERAFAGLTAFTVGPVSLQGRRESFTEDIDIRTKSPDIWAIQTKMIKVTATIQEKIVRKELSLPISVKNTDLQSSITPPEIQVTLEGPFLTIERLQTSEIEVFVDADTLRAGLYRRPIAMRVPPSLKIVDNSPRYFSIRLWR